MLAMDHTPSSFLSPAEATTVVARAEVNRSGSFSWRGTGSVDADSAREGSTLHQVKGRFSDVQPEVAGTTPTTSTVTLEALGIPDRLKQGEEARCIVNQPPTKGAERILRAHFASHILEDLQRLAEHSGETTSVVYVNTILENIRHLRDSAPEDHFLEILMGFHDALAFDNKWADYSGSQYAAAYQILKSNVNSTLDPQKVRNAILKLEKAGFNTTPFSMDIDFFCGESDLDEQED